MPVVFIHGVPDTVHLWEPILRHLRRKDAAALPLPGFDLDPPAGFDGTKEAHVAWVIEKLEQLGEPVDLVGHDWGCLLTLRVASLRPDLVRSWAAGGGPVNAAYEWHPAAKIWQTEGEGEAMLDALKPETLARRLAEGGVPLARARGAAARVDARMKAAILKLYRSALTVGAEWEPDLARVQAPGLVLWGAHDVPCPPENAARLAQATGAPAPLILDSGHWFPEQRPEEVARALQAHWAARA